MMYGQPAMCLYRKQSVFPAVWAAAMNPQGKEPGTFGHWLRLSLNEMVAAGYNFTMDESEIFAIYSQIIFSRGN